MKFREDAETVSTDDPWYDLTDGGYIKPEDLLVEEDAKKVNDALSLVQEFLNKAERKGLLEYH